MVLGRRNVGGSSADCAAARSLNWLLTAIAPAAAEDAFKNARRFIRFSFRGFTWIMALSLRFSPSIEQPTALAQAMLGRLSSQRFSPARSMSVAKRLPADGMTPAHY